MVPSKTIARLVGPTLIALNISETVNLEIWKTNDPLVTYLNGTLLFVGGLAIVLAHNRWVRGWPVVLTLVGWGAMAFGLFRMFAPRAAQGGDNLPTYAGIALILVAGVVLTIQGYRPGRGQDREHEQGIGTGRNELSSEAEPTRRRAWARPESLTSLSRSPKQSGEV